MKNRKEKQTLLKRKKSVLENQKILVNAGNYVKKKHVCSWTHAPAALSADAFDLKLKRIRHRAVKSDVKQNVAASQQIQYSFIYSPSMCTLGIETAGFDGPTQPESINKVNQSSFFSSPSKVV